MHVGIRDGLTTVLRGAALANTERLLAMPSPPVAEALLSALGRMSGMPEVPPVQAAAARFCLFQALRMNVMVAEMISDASIAEDGGLPRDLDAACEDEVRWWVVEGASQTGGVLPLRVLLVGALRSLRGRLDDVRVVVAQLGDEARADCERRKLIELMLRQMDAPDHLLLRNERFFAEDLGEQRLEMQRLLDNHPLAFSKMNRAAAYVRLQRLRKHLVHRQPIIRRGPALIDLLRAQEKGA
jgi:hypothetical protein